MAEQFRQIKRSVAEQFRQIKRSVAEHNSNINFNLARALEDKGSFIRHTHQIRCVVIVVCTIQLGCVQTRSSGIYGAKGAMPPFFTEFYRLINVRLKLQKCHAYQNEIEFHHKPNGNDVEWPHLYFSYPDPW